MDSAIGWPALMLSVALELPIRLEDGKPEPLSDYFWGHPDEAVELRRLAWGLLIACSDELELVEAAVDGGLIRSLSYQSHPFSSLCKEAVDCKKESDMHRWAKEFQAAVAPDRLL